MAEAFARKLALGGLTFLLAVVAVPAHAKEPKPVSGLRPPEGHCPGATAPGYEYPRSAFEPTITADPRHSRRITVGWFQGAGMVAKTAWTRNGGRSWRRATPPGLSGCSGGTTEAVADPQLSATADGRLYFTSLPANRVRPLFAVTSTELAVSASAGTGRKWRPPAIVVPLGWFVDKAAVTPDPRQSGTAYATWSIRSGALGQSGELYFARTDDGGRTWSTPVRVYAPLPQLLLAGNGQVFAEPDGSLVLVFDLTNESAETGGAFEYPFRVMSARSTDGGASWSEPQTVATFSGNGSRSFFHTADGYAMQVNTWPSVKTESRDGSIFVSWVDERSPSRTVIEMASSDNDGLSWSAPRQIAGVPGVAFEAQIAIDRAGTLAAYWYDMRHDRPGDGVATTNVVASESADGGLGWTRRVRLARFDIHDAPLLPGLEEAIDSALFLGDYQGFVGLRRGFAAAFAMPVAKAKPERGPSRIFFARIRDTTTSG